MPDEHIIENTEAYLNVVRPLQGYKKKAAEYGAHSYTSFAPVLYISSLFSFF